MARLPSAVGLLFAAGLLSAAPVPKAPPFPKTDREGNPLPKGATARLGSLTLSGDRLSALTFSPGGKELLAPADGKLFAWDAGTGKPLPVRPFAPADAKPALDSYAIAGGRLLTLTSGGPGRGRGRPAGMISVTDLAGRGEGARIPCAALTDFEGNYHPARIPALAVTPDGRYLSVVAEDKAVEVYDLGTGKRLHAQKIGNTYGAGAYPSPDSKVLYIRDPGKPLRRCDLVSGKELPDLNGTDRFTNLIDASPDGKWAVTRESDLRKDEAGRVVAVVNRTSLVVRDAAANKAVGELDIGSYPDHFKFVGPDAVVVLATKVRPPGPFIRSLSRWNVVTRRREWEVPAPPASRLVASPDGRRFAAFSPVGPIHLYDAATGAVVVPRTGHDGPVAWVGFTPGGGSVMTADDRQVVTWSLRGERKAAASPPELRDGWIQPPLLGDRLAWVAYGPDGKTADLVGWDDDGQAVGWRIPLGANVPERVYSHDGKRVVGVAWDAARSAWEATVYDGPAGKKLAAWPVPAPRAAGAGRGGSRGSPPLALSGDGRLLFVGGDDEVAGLDAGTGKELVRVSTGPIEPVHGRLMFPIAASADGGRLAVIAPGRAAGGFNVLVFDVKSGKKLVEHAVGKMYGATAEFSPDGKRVAVWDMWGRAVLLCDVGSVAAPRRLGGDGGSRPTCVVFSPDGANLVAGYADGTALVWDVTAR